MRKPTITETQKETILKLYQEKQSHQAIADEMKIPIGTVKTIIYRNKLNKTKTESIMELAEQGYTNGQIADALGTTKDVVKSIKCRIRKRNEGEKMPKIKFTKEQREKVKRLIVTGMAYKDIEEKTGISKNYIKQIAYEMRHEEPTTPTTQSDTDKKLINALMEKIQKLQRKNEELLQYIDILELEKEKRYGGNVIIELAELKRQNETILQRLKMLEQAQSHELEDEFISWA